MSKQGKTTTSKAISNPDFEAVCTWYRMEFSNYSFEVARDVIQSILEKKIDDRSPEYYAMTVGAICIYARPFTNNKPVGKLADDIVPANFKSLHDNIITMRHKLFAHSEATLAVGQDDYPHEAVIENDGKTIVMAVSRVAVKPDVLEQMRDLLEALIEKTNYHRSKLANKFTKTLRKLGKGQFRLNVADPTASLFRNFQTPKCLFENKRKAFLTRTRLLNHEKELATLSFTIPRQMDLAPVDHHITRRPRDVGIAELDAALEWVSDCLGRPLQGRLIEYRGTLRQVLRRARENKIELLASELSETDFLNTVFEAETLIQVWKAFHPNPPTKITDKLKIIIKSVPFARDEGEETQARNAVFELQLGVLLVERGNRSASSAIRKSHRPERGF